MVVIIRKHHYTNIDKGVFLWYNKGVGGNKANQKLIENREMATEFTTANGTIIGTRNATSNGAVFNCCMTETEFNATDTSGHVFGDDGSVFFNMFTFQHEFTGRWNWDTAAKRNAQAREMENHRFSEVRACAPAMREKARQAVRDSMS